MNLRLHPVSHLVIALFAVTLSSGAHGQSASGAAPAGTLPPVEVEPPRARPKPAAQAARPSAAPRQASARARRAGPRTQRVVRTTSPAAPAGAPGPTTPGPATLGQAPAPFAGGQVASGARLGALGNRGIFDTPFNVSSYTAKLIRDQQAQSLTDVATNDPSVRSAFSEGSAFGDNFVIRGYPVSQSDVTFDGLYGVVDGRRPAITNIERVEILKGPSALLNGIPPTGAVGGTINLVPKRAADEPLTRITPFFISQGQGGVSVDLGRRFGEAKEWGIRLNGLYRNGETSVDRERLEMGFGSAALDYRGERVRFSFDLSYQSYDGDQGRNLFTVNQNLPYIPRAPKLSRNLSQPFEFSSSTNLAGATRLEVDLTDNITAFGAFGGSAFREGAIAGFQQLLPPVYPGWRPGDFGGPYIRQAYDQDSYSGEAGIRAKFNTGFLSHQVTVSASGYQTGYDLTRPTQYFSLGINNIYDPVVLPSPVYPDPRFNARLSMQINRGVTFADTISALDERVQLTVGGRFQQITSKNYNTFPDQTFGQTTAKYDDSAWSPAVALLIKPTQNLSIYGNYIQGLVSGGTAPVGTTNFGQALPAIVSDQKEVGVKYDFGSFGVTASLFEIYRPNAGVVQTGGTVATPILTYEMDGMQRNRGVELNVFGEPVTGLRFVGGVAFTQGRVVGTGSYLTDGKTAQGVPETTFNLYGEYDLPWLLSGLTATGRLIYTSSQYVDLYNSQKIPDWTRFDAGLRYTFMGSWGKPVTLRANVNNVFGANYWASASQGYLSLGRPRTYMLSAQLDF